MSKNAAEPSWIRTTSRSVVRRQGSRCVKTYSGEFALERSYD